jgi:hypothetical protein
MEMSVFVKLSRWCYSLVVVLAIKRTSRAHFAVVTDLSGACEVTVLVPSLSGSGAAVFVAIRDRQRAN